ncbi:D-arabinose dehydrogenase [Coprinopsis cinerea AmutBmut pab1-1]|nr:D-arabinose dehydrogenase [Coprinopsis cinerea AmutBmut pab1-1]
MPPLDLEHVVLDIHKTYKSLSFTPPHSQYTVLASFFLVNDFSGDHKIISLATGTKCVPANRLSGRGELVHDSHAEVLARRGALRWLLEEVSRVTGVLQAHESLWIIRDDHSGKFRLRDSVTLNLYVSTLPCGDASMRFLASIQDEEMAALKGTTVFPTLDPTAASRGRDNYGRLGVLRTKPGRADSPPTLCMSCSDKIALWNVVGIQGALGSLAFSPVYISRIVIGDCEVPEGTRVKVKEDCERAFWGRLRDYRIELPIGYRICRPTLLFSSTPFIHAKSPERSNGSCNEAIAWIADSGSKGHEILINGLKRGVSPKHRYNEKSRSRFSRLSLFQLATRLHGIIPGESEDTPLLYSQIKQLSTQYHSAKQAVLGPAGPFVGWVRAGVIFQQFNLQGLPELRNDDTDT